MCCPESFLRKDNTMAEYSILLHINIHQRHPWRKRSRLFLNTIAVYFKIVFPLSRFSGQQKIFLGCNGRCKKFVIKQNYATQNIFHYVIPAKAGIQCREIINNLMLNFSNQTILFNLILQATFLHLLYLQSFL